MSWVDALELHQDEKVVDSWQGIHEILGETFDVSLDKEKEKEKKKVTTQERKEGLLILTNQRLLFLEGQEPDAKKLSESVKVSLIDVNQLLFQKAPLKSIEEVKGYETHVFTLKKVGKKKEFKAFRKLVEEFVQRRKKELDEETRKVTSFRV
jgi:hypothetical protein